MTTSPSASAGADGQRVAGGFGALFRNEVLKTRKRLAFWVTTGLFALLNGGETVDSVQREMKDPERVFSLPESWPGILVAPANMGPFFLALLLILLVAPEFQWRTARQNVIDGLSKERFYVGKAMALAVLVVLFFVLPLAIGGAGALLSPGENGPDLVLATDFSYMTGYALSLLLLGSAAVMLAVLVRSSGPALGALFAYILVEEFLSFFLERYESLRDVTSHFPMALHDALNDSRFHYPERLAEANAARAESGVPPLEFLDHGVVVTATLLYSAVFLVVAFVGMRKRDL